MSRIVMLIDINIIGWRQLRHSTRLIECFCTDWDSRFRVYFTFTWVPCIRRHDNYWRAYWCRQKLASLNDYISFPFKLLRAGLLLEYCSQGKLEVVGWHLRGAFLTQFPFRYISLSFSLISSFHDTVFIFADIKMCSSRTPVTPTKTQCWIALIITAAPLIYNTPTFSFDMVFQVPIICI